MKKFTIIGTWRMSYQGLQIANKSISKSETLKDAMINAVVEVENFQYFKSVGFGGLPNEDGIVELDAGFMDGRTKKIGAVMGIRDFANPIKIAESLSHNKYNTMLVGHGAEKYATINNFEKKNMLSERAKKAWTAKKEYIIKNGILNPYDGHDTVCFCGTDTENEMYSVTSTSGLFMKKEGRIGDSPITGAGFYADNEIGAAAATGLGEDITRGVLSYEVIVNMRAGMNPNDAAKKALFSYIENMNKRNEKIGAISLIAVNNQGQWGVATNCLFQFSVLTEKDKEPKLYVSTMTDDEKDCVYSEVEDGYWDEYITSITTQDIKV